jgi:serine/threonine-protein kinase
MDYLDGGDLRNLMKSQGQLDEKDVCYILGCIGSALHHMHVRGVIHRDVKPENIGLSLNGRPYLTDFGISMVCDNIHNRTSIPIPIPISESSSGTLPYLAPEVFKGKNIINIKVIILMVNLLIYGLVV